MKKLVAPVLLSCSALLLTACGSGTGSSDDSTVDVVASFYPFAYVAEQVGGDAVTVADLTNPGVEPHDIELTPKQVGSVEKADLVLFESGFQAAVDQAVEQADRPASAEVDVADLIDLHPYEDDDNGEDDHGHGALDPHVWLDPENMVTITDAVTARLSAIAPEDAPAFERNARAFKAKLTTLDKDYRNGLARCDRRQFVTSHAAFSYLADEYDLAQVAIAGIDPTNEPSASQLADITSLVEKDGITTVFTEELVSPKIADAVAEETGVSTAVLSPIEGLTDETADQTYLTLMRQNLAALQKANGCS